MFGNITPEQLGKFGGWSGFAGGTIDALDSLDGKRSGVGSFLSGAGAGASAGAMLGPIGAVAGGVIGGVTSLFTQRKQKKDMAEQKRQAEELRLTAELDVRKGKQLEMNNKFNVNGMDVPGFYALGGKVKADYLAEGGETIQHDPFDLPATYNGALDRLSSDTSEIKGPSHESKSRGVAMSGGERIFSDRMPVSKQAVKYFKRNL